MKCFRRLLLSPQRYSLAALIAAAGRSRCYIVVVVLVLIVACVGDWLITVDQCTGLCRALADSLTHALLGALTWYLVDPTSIQGNNADADTGGDTSTAGKQPQCLDYDRKHGKVLVHCRSKRRPWLEIDRNVGVVLVMSSLIDIDHFIEAQSLSLQQATSLEHRPFAHQLCLLPLWFFAVRRIANQKTAWAACCPWFLHLVRDGVRRGMWIIGKFSTPPVPYVLYLTATVSLGPMLSSLLGYRQGSQLVNNLLEQAREPLAP